MAFTKTHMFTWSDIQQLPDDGLRRELVGGQLLVTPAPSLPHQRAVLRLARLLEDAGPSSHEVYVAPCDWYLAEDTYFEPDVLVIPRPSASDRRFEGVPLLVVEILSPSTRTADLVTKRHVYSQARAPHYWIVDPEAPSILALGLDGDHYVEAERATGKERLSVTEPFPVEVVPASLVA